MDKSKVTGAGIIAYFDNTDGSIKGLEEDLLYLILIDKSNDYDFPKGGIDKSDDTIFDCAIRETKEEISLHKNDFLRFDSEIDEDGYCCGEKLVLFLGELSKDSLVNAVIGTNPKTLEKEHLDYTWLSYKKILEDERLKDYLVPGIKWAHKKINSYK